MMGSKQTRSKSLCADRYGVDEAEEERKKKRGKARRGEAASKAEAI